jgi:F420 biosynthesis protein FbiB-like protein
LAQAHKTVAEEVDRAPLAAAESALAQAIRLRRSVRHFLPGRVPDGTIANLIREAAWAPSPHNSQPWGFTVLADDARTRLAYAMAESLRADLARQGMSTAEIEAQASKSVTRISQAPNALLCSATADGLRLTGDPTLDSLETKMATQSLGAVLQTLFLLAAEQGIATCWMAAPMYCPETVRAVLHLPPGYEPQALILFGFAADSGRVRPRRSVEELVEFR